MIATALTLEVIYIVFIIFCISMFIRNRNKKNRNNNRNNNAPNNRVPSKTRNASSRPMPRLGRSKRDSIGADHEVCTHVSITGGLDGFEDRQHDWLAKQIAEERRIRNKLM